MTLYITGPMSSPVNILDGLPRPCWARIDTAQLAENVRLLQKVVDRPVLGVVKANGYGHGYENAARAFLKGGVRYIGVATLSEGLVLRKLGLTCPILVICGLLPEELATAAQADIEFFVWRPDQIAALRQLPSGARAKVHIEIETGMGRGGCWPNEAPQIAKSLQEIPNVEITGLCTHFASADIPGIDDTDNQLAVFEKTVAALAAAGVRPKIVHAANSPGGLYFPKARYDMVRLGIVAYGVPPDDGLEIPAGVKTVLTWSAKISSTKIFPAGHGVSYGSEYKMPKEGRVGVLQVGYADGFQRVPKNVNSVLVDGQERKTLGRICMDQCMIDLDGFGDITGAEVVLVGRQGNVEISVEEVARRWKTNTYNVYTGIAARVPRVVS
jgi:alanine racemase